MHAGTSDVAGSRSELVRMAKEHNRYISHGLYTDPPAKRRKRDYKANPVSSIFKLSFDWEMLDFLLSKLKDESFNVTMHCNDFRAAHCGHHLKRAGISKDELDRLREEYFSEFSSVDEMLDEMDEDLAAQIYTELIMEGNDVDITTEGDISYDTSLDGDEETYSDDDDYDFDDLDYNDEDDNDGFDDLDAYGDDNFDDFDEDR